VENEIAMQMNEKRRDYWRKSMRLTGMLLAIWFVTTFLVIYFARELSFNFFGWPFSFWMAAQGSLIVYVAIIWYYARYMNALDKEFGANEAAGTDRPTVA
jgi:putative solute:sodium symporter small subunit